MSIQLHGGKGLVDPLKVLEQGGIKQGYTVADFGCGTSGHFVFPAAHLVGSRGIVYAVDVQKSVLSSIESRRKLEGVDNLKTVWADLERPGATKIVNASVDCVLLLNTLFQIKDKAVVLRETKRVVKPGAAMVIVEWEQTNTPFGPAVEQRVGKESIKNLAQQVGFKLTGEFKAGPYHWGMVFKG